MFWAAAAVMTKGSLAAAFVAAMVLLAAGPAMAAAGKEGTAWVEGRTWEAAVESWWAAGVMAAERGWGARGWGAGADAARGAVAQEVMAEADEGVVVEWEQEAAVAVETWRAMVGGGGARWAGAATPNPGLEAAAATAGAAVQEGAAES